jgi:Na+-transporting NADH:ubiquinone oxidoreductase subunit A
LSPVGADRAVWHIDCQDVIALGHLFADGRIRTERTVALGGSGFSSPRMVTTRLGASIADLAAGEAAADGNDPALRLISGSVLSGRIAHGAEAYLGRYHLQVTAVSNVVKRRIFASLRPTGKAFTASGVFRSNKKRTLSTSRNGRPAALLPVDAFENILPMDILPIPLLRALLISDTDQAQALGCLELDDEDLALCSFVCPGKIDYGAVLRVNLEQIEREG